MQLFKFSVIIILKSKIENRVGPHLVDSASTVRDLGIYIDADLSGRKQVLKTTASPRRVLLLCDSCGQYVGACRWPPTNR